MEADMKRFKKVIGELEGKFIVELNAQGPEKLNSVPAGEEASAAKEIEEAKKEVKKAEL